MSYETITKLNKPCLTEMASYVCIEIQPKINIKIKQVIGHNIHERCKLYNFSYYPLNT